MTWRRETEKHWRVRTGVPDQDNIVPPPRALLPRLDTIANPSSGSISSSSNGRVRCIHECCPRCLPSCWHKSYGQTRSSEVRPKFESSWLRKPLSPRVVTTGDGPSGGRRVKKKHSRAGTFRGIEPRRVMRPVNRHLVFQEWAQGEERGEGGSSVPTNMVEQEPGRT